MKALITGASSGIGKELAIELASRGYDLILVARRGLELKELKKQLPVNVKCYQLDLSDMKNIEYLYKQTRKEDIDIVINNAGFGLFGNFSETDLTREFEMIDLNIKAVHYMTKLYLYDFIKKDKGHILNVASSAGFTAGPKMATYYATKNYVVSLSEGVREEFRKKRSNVRISVLCPGPVKTNFDNVAGVNFSLKGKSSEYVAKYTVKQLMKGKFYIVPGMDIKFLRFISGIIPNGWISRVVYYQQRKKL
jgi:short-subunit dehydrogenase